MNPVEFEALQERIGFRFSSEERLLEVLTHSSALNEGLGADRSNESLALLGDAVLRLIVLDHLRSLNPVAPVGRLSPLRDEVVSRDQLALAGARIGLADALALGRGLDLTRDALGHGVLAEAVEALVGAVYQDAGLHEANRGGLIILEPVLTVERRNDTPASRNGV